MNFSQKYMGPVFFFVTLYMYIYIYMCVCVCVCVVNKHGLCVFNNFGRSAFQISRDMTGLFVCVDFFIDVQYYFLKAAFQISSDLFVCLDLCAR